MNRRVWVREGFWALIVSSVLLFVGSAILLHWEVEALRVIPMQQDLTSLFGEEVKGYTPLGSRQGYIVLDPQAFFREGDMVLLNQTYLEKHGLYPLQGRTVRLVRNVNLGFVILMGLMGAFLFKVGFGKVKTQGAEKHLT